MTTVLTLTIQDPETLSSWRVELAEDFDTVFGKLFPLTPPTSNLEHRANLMHTLADGRRIAIQPGYVAVIAEGEDE